MTLAKEHVIKLVGTAKTYVGIELGSTRIKAVLISENSVPIASGEHQWTNSYVDGMWTYSLEEVWEGIRHSYQGMVESLKNTYGVTLEQVGGIGISAMMHGYMVFDKKDNQLVPFRTWRNNTTGKAAERLKDLFDYPIPQRWSIAHLAQAVMDEEDHIKDIAYMTTLAGYVHYRLTTQKVIGIGEASGMFPIDLRTKDYNETMMKQFDETITEGKCPWKLKEIMPKVLVAGEEAGSLTDEGAKLLDPTGTLRSGVPMCPPEGDAGTGMVATNSVAKRTGNVSAGTSVFAMIVLEHELSKVHSEIDLVTTPAGDLVAMAHSNNCSSDLDGWVNLFGEAATLLGAQVDKNQLYQSLYTKALEGEADGGGLLSYGYLSGEHMTHFDDGRPLFTRSVEGTFNLANFMRTHLMSALGALAIGIEVLLVEEKVEVDQILGHGGFFKTKGVGQSIMAAATNTPVALMETAGEGGPYGMALLASYMVRKEEGESLEAYLSDKVFAKDTCVVMAPDEKDVAGFRVFMERYRKGLSIEREAVKVL